MAGQGRNGGRGGRNTGGRECSGGRGTGRTSSTTTTKSALKGLCAELEGNVFDIGQQTSEDLLRMTLEKLIQYVGTKYGEDIADELKTRQVSTTAIPQHTTEVL